VTADGGDTPLVYSPTHHLEPRTSHMAPTLFHTAPDTATYFVAGMTCDHCKVAVTDEVTSVAGVTSVDIDLATKLVRVHGTDVDKAAVVAAIDEAGYDAVTA
jgi:copper chaperone